MSRRGMIFDQAAFVHLLDEVVDGGAPGLAVADRPAQVVVGFVDRGVLAVRLPFDQDGQCPAAGAGKCGVMSKGPGAASIQLLALPAGDIGRYLCPPFGFTTAFDATEVAKIMVAVC